MSVVEKPVVQGLGWPTTVGTHSTYEFQPVGWLADVSRETTQGDE